MKRFWTTLAVLAMVAAPATAAFGQENFMEDENEINNGADFGPDIGDWELIVSGSGSNNKDFDAGSFNITGDIGYYFTEEMLVALRQSVSYSSLGAGEDWSGNTRVAADYHFDFGRFRPFVGGNIGYLYGDGVDDTWAAGPEAGVKWYLQDKAFLFGRVEYQFFFDSSDDVEDNFDDGNFIYTVGIGMNF